MGSLRKFEIPCYLEKRMWPLLKLLISDVEAELSSGYFLPHLIVSCNFLALLQLAENQKVVLEFWKSSKPSNMDRNTASSIGRCCFWFKARRNVEGSP
nr:hypothetical protein CFP56_73920 [Quercus suber]